MLIFRVEDKLGKGVYQSKCGWDIDFLTRHNSRQIQRFQDAILAKSFNKFLPSVQYRFAFKSLKQLTKWFNKKQLKELNAFGFLLSVYNSPKIYNGKTQVCFPAEYHNRNYLIKSGRILEMLGK